VTFNSDVWRFGFGGGAPLFLHQGDYVIVLTGLNDCLYDASVTGAVSNKPVGEPDLINGTAPPSPWHTAYVEVQGPGSASSPDFELAESQGAYAAHIESSSRSGGHCGWNLTIRHP
jgi:hypothetical protein